MELNKMSKEEIEILSYTDLTELILMEKKKPLNTPTIFKEICALLEYSDDVYAEKIGDYYTSLTTDKRFTLLDTAEWDLKTNHVIPLVLDEDEEEDLDEIVLEGDIEEGETEEEEDIDTLIDDDDLDDDDVEMDDLSIVPEEELEES